MKLNAVCVQCMIDGHVNNVSKLTNVDEDTKEPAIVYRRADGGYGVLELKTE